MSHPYGWIYFRKMDSAGQYKIGQSVNPIKRGKDLDMKDTDLVLALPVWGTKTDLDRYEKDLIDNLSIKYRLVPGKKEWFYGDCASMVSDIVKHRTLMDQLTIPGTPRPSIDRPVDNFDYNAATEPLRIMLRQSRGPSLTMRDFVKLLLFRHPQTRRLYWYNHQLTHGFSTHVHLQYLYNCYTWLSGQVFTLDWFARNLLAETVCNSTQYRDGGQPEFEHRLWLVYDSDGTHTISTFCPTDATTPCMVYNDHTNWHTPPQYTDAPPPSFKEPAVNKNIMARQPPASTLNKVPQQYRSIVTAIMEDNMIWFYYQTTANRVSYISQPIKPYVGSDRPLPVNPVLHTAYPIIINTVWFYRGEDMGIGEQYLVAKQIANGGLPIFEKDGLKCTNMYIVGDSFHDPAQSMRNIIVYRMP